MELGKEGSWVKGKNFLRQNCSIIIDRVHFHTVFERLEVELLQESSFRSLNFFVFSAHLEIFGDFNLSLDNFSGDVKSVEEVDLGGIETSGSCGNGKVDGGNDSNSSFGRDFVSFDFSFEVIDGSISEDQSNLLLEEGGKDFQSRDFASELFLEMFEFIIFNAVSSHFDDFFDESLSQR